MIQASSTKLEGLQEIHRILTFSPGTLGHIGANQSKNSEQADFFKIVSLQH